jgi:hypothetical protein
MAEHKVEIRPYQVRTVGRRSFLVDSQQCHLLVDGQFLGYVSREPGCGLTILGVVPQEIVVAVKEAVESYWGQEVYAMNQVRPMEPEEEEEADYYE